MFNKFIGSAIACSLFAVNSFAYELTLVPKNSDLAVGFTPGSPATGNKPGQTADDPSHSMDDFTQLRVISPEYHAPNNIAGLSVDQKVQKATVQLQTSAYGEAYKLDVYYNGNFIGSGISKGTNRINITDFQDSGKVLIKVSEVRVRN